MHKIIRNSAKFNTPNSTRFFHEIQRNSMEFNKNSRITQKHQIIPQNSTKQTTKIHKLPRVSTTCLPHCCLAGQKSCLRYKRNGRENILVANRAVVYYSSSLAVLHQKSENTTQLSFCHRAVSEVDPKSSGLCQQTKRFATRIFSRQIHCLLQ